MEWKKVAQQLITANNVIQFSKKKFYPNNCYGLIYSVNSPFPQMIGPESVVENYREEKWFSICFEKDRLSLRKDKVHSLEGKYSLVYVWYSESTK